MKNKYIFVAFMIILYSLIIFFFLPVYYYQCALFEGGCDRKDFILGFYALNPYSALFTKDFEKGFITSFSIALLLSPIIYYFLHINKNRKKLRVVFWTLFSVSFLTLFVGYTVYLEIIRTNNLKAEDLVLIHKDSKYCDDIKIPIKIKGIPSSSLKEAFIYSKDLCYLYVTEQTKDISLCSRLINPTDTSTSVNSKYSQLCPN